MYAVTVRASAEEGEILMGEMYDLGTAGVREEWGRMIIYFEAAADANACARLFRNRLISVAETPPEDYANNWQKDWVPTLVGERFFLAPPWDDTPAPAGRARLNMRPGYVFGAGDHPTTQLCLQLLEKVVSSTDRVLDVGSGTGILSMAACKLEAGLVAACDTHSEAAYATQEEAPSVLVWQGSTQACRSSAFTVVMANLPTGDLIHAMEELQRVVVRRGRLILSGFFEEQWEEVSQAIESCGLEIVSHQELGDWAACLATKRA